MDKVLSFCTTQKLLKKTHQKKKNAFPQHFSTHQLFHLASSDFNPLT